MYVVRHSHTCTCTYVTKSHALARTSLAHTHPHRHSLGAHVHTRQASESTRNVRHSYTCTSMHVTRTHTPSQTLACACARAHVCTHLRMHETGFKEGEGTLLPLWKFWSERARRKHVTALCWSTLPPTPLRANTLSLLHFAFLRARTLSLALSLSLARTHTLSFSLTLSAFLSFLHRNVSVSFLHRNVSVPHPPTHTLAPSTFSTPAPSLARIDHHIYVPSRSLSDMPLYGSTPLLGTLLGALRVRLYLHQLPYPHAI